MTVEIALRNRHGNTVAVAVVDDTDSDLALLRWYLSSEGYARRKRKVCDGGHGDHVYLHHVILERKLGRPIAAGMRADHENRTKFDNRRNNLREATPSQNSGNANLNANNSSGYRGVSREKRTNKWRAYGNERIGGKTRQTHLGQYDCIEDAARAWDAWAQNRFGDFASLNFPDCHPSLRWLCDGELPAGWVRSSEVHDAS